MPDELAEFDIDLRHVIDTHIRERGLDREQVEQVLRDLRDEVDTNRYQTATGMPLDEFPDDPLDAYGRFGGTTHYKLIQAALHRLIARYWEKNSKLQIENEDLSFTSSLAGFGRHSARRAEKEIHPDIVLSTEPGEAGMAGDKTVVVECETRKNGLLANDLRMAAYELLRQGNKDRNKMMLYVAFPESLRGDVEKPDWANDLWFFEVDGP